MVPDRAVLMQDENQREIATVNYTRQEVGARRRKVFNTMPWAQKRRQEPRQKTISMLNDIVHLFPVIKLRRGTPVSDIT